MGENLRTFDDIPAVIVVKPSQVEEVIRAVIHTIIFHRALGRLEVVVETQCSVLSDLIYVRCDDPKICSQVEQAVHSFAEDFKKGCAQAQEAAFGGPSGSGGRSLKLPGVQGGVSAAGEGVRSRSNSTSLGSPPGAPPSLGGVAGGAGAVAAGPLHTARLELRFYDEERRLWGYLNNRHYWERWIIPVELHPELRCRAHPHAVDQVELHHYSPQPKQQQQQQHPPRHKYPSQQPPQQHGAVAKACDSCRRVEAQHRAQHEALRSCLVAVIQNAGAGIDHLSAIKEDSICFPFDVSYQDRRSGSKWFQNISLSGLKDFSAPNLTKMP